MVITIFRSRLRTEHQDEYEQWGARIHDLAVKMPGFISIKTFAAEDGERVSIVEFESEETMRAWREQETHREAQELGENCFIRNTEFRSVSRYGIIHFRKRLA